MDNKELINKINEIALCCIEDLSRNMGIYATKGKVRYLYGFNDGVTELRRQIIKALKTGQKEEKTTKGGTYGENQKP